MRRPVNLNCPETSSASVVIVIIIGRVQTQKGLTDRQLFLDSMCCGAVPFVVVLVVNL